MKTDENRKLADEAGQSIRNHIAYLPDLAGWTRAQIVDSIASAYEPVFDELDRLRAENERLLETLKFVLDVAGKGG